MSCAARYKNWYVDSDLLLLFEKDENFFEVFMKRFWYPTLFSFVLITVSFLYAAEFLTPGEASRYSHYTTNGEIGEFLSRLQALSPVDLQLSIIGESSERDPIYMATLSRQGVKEDSLLKVFIIATQHGDEQSGKEACLRLIRDVAIGPLNYLLDSLRLYIVPLVNPYGAHHNQRVNGQGLDLNRDHVKLEAPEIRAVHRAFNRIFPEVTLDVHEKGDDYYLENIGLISNANIPSHLQQYGREKVLPYVEEKLRQQKITFHEYLIRERIEATGATVPSAQGRSGKEAKFYYRYSTTDINDGRNSFGIYHTLSFILEGASSGRLDDLGRRTHNQYQAIKAWLEYCYENQKQITAMVRKAREALLLTHEPVHLRMLYQPTVDKRPLEIYALSRVGDDVLGTLRVKKSEGDEISWRDIQPLDRKKRKVEKRIIDDWRPVVQAVVSRPLAVAYAIPPGYQQIIRTLLDHEIPLSFLSNDVRIKAEMYRVIKLVPSGADHEAPQVIKVEIQPQEVILRRGTIIVESAGRHRQLVPILLEPESEYGLIRYDRYGLVPQEGDFYAIYRLYDVKDLPLVPYLSFNQW